LELKRLFLLITLFSLAALTGCPGRPPKIVIKTCSDAGCHAKDFDRFKEGILHKPVAEKKCESCHLPHGLIGALRLKAEDAALCYRCHEKDKQKLEKAHLHTPLK
jgi:predicted CXXCH cytochrome family protein